MSFYNNDDLYKSLAALEVIPKEKLDDAYQESRVNKVPLHEPLLRQELISSDDVVKVIAELLKIPFVKLSNVSIPENVLHILPEVTAKAQRAICFALDNKGLHVAMVDPTRKEIIELLKKKTSTIVNVYLTTDFEISSAISLYHKDAGKAFSKYLEEYSEGGVKYNNEASIIKLVDIIVEYGYQNGASDIHIEPINRQSVIRYRVDGILHDIVKLPVSLHPNIITRIKVLSELRTDEHQAAQDGKIVYKIEEDEVNIRVSIVPITDGEKVVMRILSDKSRQFTIKSLGLSQADFKKLESSYNRPHGMILSTGPTGSGKTTTLYSILKMLNRRDVNIMTIEDPVEYDMDGVNQIQVNTQTELTFAKGLRSIVRQDPDIVLVGEIRDSETASISINAAMTGHLVLSTLHTNDSATTFPRLFDLGVESFLVGSSVNIVIAQRLVRKICLSCRVSVDFDVHKAEEQIIGVSGEFLKRFLGSDVSRTYKGKGCEICHNTGYNGRIGIFEILEVDDLVRKAIVDKRDSNEIKEIARKNGMATMLEDGLEKVSQGLTTLEEVLRVTKE